MNDKLCYTCSKKMKAQYLVPIKGEKKKQFVCESCFLEDEEK